MNAIVWLVFGAACAAMAILGFYEKAKARKKEERDSAQSRKVSQ
jgi:hypothetical protein